MFISVYKSLQSQSVDVLVAPYHPAIASAATRLQIPYLTMTIAEPGGRTDVMVDLLPNFGDLARLVHHMAAVQQWGQVAVIYDGGMGESTEINYHITTLLTLDTNDSQCFVYTREHIITCVIPPSSPTAVSVAE